MTDHPDIVERLGYALRDLVPCKANNYAIFAIQDAQVELERLSAETEALRKDAERYRWLRERMEIRKVRAVSGSVRDAIQMRVGQSFFDTPTRGARGYCDEFEFTRECSRLDIAIDAAIAATKEQQA